MLVHLCNVNNQRERHWKKSKSTRCTNVKWSVHKTYQNYSCPWVASWLVQIIRWPRDFTGISTYDKHLINPIAKLENPSRLSGWSTQSECWRYQNVYWSGVHVKNVYLESTPKIFCGIPFIIPSIFLLCFLTV
jgi:hypothetical protein